MANKANVKRYAQAIFDIAMENHELDKWQAELSKVAVLNEDPEIPVLLENPRLGFEDKKKLIAGALHDVGPMALNLAYLLVSKGILTSITEIAGEYQKMLDAHQGIERAEVITAVPLDDEDRKNLESRLGAVVGKKVLVKEEVDPEMLGGIVARMGGKLLDGSVRSRLAALKNEIEKAPR